MKKLLLVLMVVAMASFLLVGCLGTGTTPEPTPEPEPEPEPTVQAVTITVVDQYPAAPAKAEYIAAKPLKVTVEFALPVGEND